MYYAQYGPCMGCKRIEAPCDSGEWNRVFPSNGTLCPLAVETFHAATAKIVAGEQTRLEAFQVRFEIGGTGSYNA